MFLKPVCSEIVVEQKEQERIRDRFPSILHHTSIKCLQPSPLIVDLLEGVNYAFVFAFIGN
jgi:hypothetical protein